MSKQQSELIQTPDYHQIQQNFLNELILSSQKKPSSLSFIRHDLPEKPLIISGIVQGIVIGGTNYILSTEKIHPDGSRKIIERKNGVLPVFATKQTFVDFMNDHLDSRADAIGINFGFQLAPAETTDGTLDGYIRAKGTKEHTFIGIDEPIGSLVKMIYKKKFHKEVLTSIANDTICLLIAGDGTETASLIAGTGFNIGFVSKDKNQTTLVNLEAGNFDKFELPPSLQQIDRKTKNPGYKLFEKTVSGKYLARYFNEKIKELNLPIQSLSTSQELSELSNVDHADIAGDLARAIITRSAFLVGTIIAALYKFSGEPEQFTIVGEGSLLWDGWQYHENIKRKLTELGVSKDVINIKHIKDSSINGAIGLIAPFHKKS